MSRLAVFDIDGTLTDTNVVDDECWVRAVSEILQIDPERLDWSEAPHVTDAGLLRWLADRNEIATVSAEQEARVIERFVGLLTDTLAASPGRFAAIAGAPDVCELLVSRDWQVAFATGGWERSARLKLKTIGIDSATFAFASSSDAATRHEIIRLAVDRAATSHGQFERVVSVGDALWDVRTAAELGLPFVGIATGQHAERLRAGGATTILSDLADAAAVCAALETAAIPRVRA